MSREIRFRAWDAERECMSSHPNRVEFTVKNNGTLSAKNFRMLGKGTQQLEIMQFTGLTDKNGKDIFEGDIVQLTRKDWYCVGHPKHKKDLIDNNEIYFCEKRSALRFRTIDLTRNEISGKYSSSGFLPIRDDRAADNILEVIGNIYENPELLEAE